VASSTILLPFRRYLTTACLFLGAFAKLRKANIDSVRPSVWNSAHTARIIMSILSIFVKYVKKVQVSLKSDKNNGYFT
jgi:hypothetical protein